MTIWSNVDLAHRLNMGVAMYADGVDIAATEAAMRVGASRIVSMTADLRQVTDRIDRLQVACSRQNAEICQVLGKALGYPWFKDDPANFPDATEEHGVCVGDHVAESLADEAAKRIERLETEVARLQAEREKDREALRRVNGAGAEQDGALGRILRMQRIALARLENTHDPR